MSTSKKTSTMKSLIIIIVFTVVSAALSLIKFPSPAGSIALDSSPGFFVAAFFSPILGSIVGFLGHLASASTGGFPYGILHIYIAIEMFIWCFVFGIIIKKINNKISLIVAGIISCLLNGVIGPLILTITPISKLPSNVAISLIPFLLLAAAVNILLATIAFIFITKIDIQGL